MSASPASAYPATYDIDYPESLSRLTTFFRLFTVIPAVILSSLVVGSTNTLSFAVAVMLLFRKRYPEPWFRWALYLQQYSARVGVYAALLVDEYPSTTERQRVHVDATLDEASLNRFLPLVKWLLALPHYIVLAFLWIAVVLVTILAWFVILIRGRYPRGMHTFVTGVLRWTWRVTCYVSLLSTDRYPPFSLK